MSRTKGDMEGRWNLQLPINVCLSCEEENEVLRVENEILREENEMNES